MHLTPGCLTKLGIQALSTVLEHDSSEILFEVTHTYFLHFDFLGKEEQFCHMGGTHTAFLPQVQNLHSEMASVSSSVGQITWYSPRFQNNSEESIENIILISRWDPRNNKPWPVFQIFLL